MSTAVRHPILVGCSSWSYSDWVGPFYPEGIRENEYLEYYSDRFDIVEVDSTFYRPPTAAIVRNWVRRTPESFRFTLKVPRVITHEKRLKGCEAEVEGFVSAIRPLGSKLVCALLQMEYFNQSKFASLEAFLETLDAFLDLWPHEEVPLAVETRNNRWVGPELVETLRDHNTALTLTEQSWMPRPSEIVRKLDAVTGPLAYVRMLGDRDGIEKITQTWERIVVDRSVEMAETVAVIEELATRVPVCVFSTNHFAGHSPGTVRELRKLLGQPDPPPPERPRTTLF